MILEINQDSPHIFPIINIQPTGLQAVVKIFGFFDKEPHKYNMWFL